MAHVIAILFLFIDHRKATPSLALQIFSRPQVQVLPIEGKRDLSIQLASVKTLKNALNNAKFTLPTLPPFQCPATDSRKGRQPDRATLRQSRSNRTIQGTRINSQLRTSRRAFQTAGPHWPRYRRVSELSQVTDLVINTGPLRLQLSEGERYHNVGD